MVHLILSAVLPILCLSAAEAWAQAVYGTLSGRVLDPSRAAIPEAVVTVTDLATNAPTVAISDADGVFCFTRLAPAYRVSIEKAGFPPQVREPVPVLVNEQVVVDVILELGGIEAAPGDTAPLALGSGATR